MYIITNNDLYVSTLLWFLFASLHPISSTGSHKNYLGWAASFFWNSCAALEIYSCTSWCRTFHLHLDMIYWSELESTTPLFRHEEIRLCMRNRSPTFPSSLCLYLSQGSLSAGLRGPQLFLGYPMPSGNPASTLGSVTTRSEGWCLKLLPEQIKGFVLQHLLLFQSSFPLINCYFCLTLFSDDWRNNISYTTVELSHFTGGLFLKCQAVTVANFFCLAFLSL